MEDQGGAPGSRTSCGWSCTIQAYQQRRPPSLSSYRSFKNLSMKREGNKACVLSDRSRGTWASLTMRPSFCFHSGVFPAMLSLLVHRFLRMGLLYPVSQPSPQTPPAAVPTLTKCSVIACGVAQLIGVWNPGRRGRAGGSGPRG